MEITVVFAKTPIAGSVKTRLSSHLAPSECARLASAFLGDLVESLQLLANSTTRIALPEADPEGPVRQIAGEGIPLLNQGKGDLGQRLARVTAQVLEEAAVVTVVGSDHPNLPLHLLDAARSSARAGRAGWIRTEDGGFAALSLSRPAPGLFWEVPWSTPGVAAAVRENARRTGVLLDEAGEWYDVDTPADLLRLQADLAATGGCPRTRAFLEHLDPPLASRPPGFPEGVSS